MTKAEQANDYLSKGWFKDMTELQIKNEISQLQAETKRTDKRTYNGKMTKAFNTAKITIANVILEAQSA